MAEATLVDADIEAGRELVRALDAEGFPVTAAAWIHFPDDDEWRLVIRTPEASKDLLAALGKVQQAMEARGDLRRRLHLPRVKLVPPNDRLLEAMGRTIQVPGISTIRWERNMVNGMYIGDAVVYRLAA